MQKRLYIVRHGETEYNAKGICQGQKLDVGLMDTGRQQAKIAAAKLENFPVGAIYTSPMRRAPFRPTGGLTVRTRCAPALPPGERSWLPSPWDRSSNVTV